MSNELTDVRCPCGAEFQADSYDAGFIAGSGMCQNCDAALPPKDICTCPSGDGSLRHPCPAHPAAEQAGGDERAAFFKHLIGRHPAHETEIVRVVEHNHAAWKAWQARAALAQPSPKCVKCGGTGEADSGGVHPWGEPVLIPCDCETEQAEAERPEAVAWQYRVTAGPQTGWSLWHPGKGEEFERSYTVERRPLMTVAQHDRIVGELLTALTSMTEARNRYNNLWNCAGNRLALAQVEIRKVTSERYAALARIAELEKELAESEKRGSELAASYCDGVIGDEHGHPYCRYKVERDAALAEVERLRESKCDPSGSFDRCMKMMYERDENAKQLEFALARVAELEKELAMARDAAAKGDAARQQCGGMEMEIQELRENAAKLAAFAQEIISGALEGGSFDGADIQESAERHGLIAKQMMREPCRGPEEYCACAWSTSFPTECYRITADLRVLLKQGKENGDHAA
ncbi:hypothetical protein ACEP3U_21735 [Pseudomonas aeruginosa]